MKLINNRNKPFWILMIGMVIIVLIVKFMQKDKVEQSELNQAQLAPLVEVEELMLSPFEDTIFLTGTIKGEKEIELKFPVGGRIDKFSFKEGDRINKGDVIVRLDQEKAKLILEKKELEFKKIDKLYELNAVTFDKLKESKIEYELAKVEFNETEIKAFQNGIMGAKYAQEDQQITTQDKIASFIAYDEVFLETGIIERYIGKINSGQNVKIKVDRWEDKEFLGVVESIAPRLEGMSRSLTTKIRVKTGLEFLMPGMFAKAEVIVFKKENALAFDIEALLKDENNKYYVFCLNKDNKIFKKYVDIIYSNDKYAVPADGMLLEKDMIIAKPSSNLQEGAEVRVKQI